MVERKREEKKRRRRIRKKEEEENPGLEIFTTRKIKIRDGQFGL